MHSFLMDHIGVRFLAITCTLGISDYQAMNPAYLPKQPLSVIVAMYYVLIMLVIGSGGTSSWYEDVLNGVLSCIHMPVTFHMCMCMLDLQECTEDEARNPPLVLAARYLPKHLFEGEITKEVNKPTPEREDDDKQISKQPVTMTESKEDSHADDTPEFHEVVNTAGKDAKLKKERSEKITAEKGKTGTVETTFHLLLQLKVNVNSHNNAGVTALHAACERGIIAMVNALLSVHEIEKDKTDEHKNTPMHTACVSGEKDVVSTLINAGANIRKVNDDKMTPLHVAVVERNLEIVKMILDMCAEKDELLKAKEKDGNSPFLLAMKTGDEEIMKFFLHNGANVADKNFNGTIALHLAASLNKVGIMELVYVTDDGEELLEEEDSDKCTALHLAAKYNQIEAMEFLLKK